MGGQAFAQTDIIGHGGGYGYYLGWDAGALQTLDIKHRGNYPIDFYTADLFRARINERTQYPIGAAPTASRDGFTLLSGRSDYMQYVKGPFSRLHLADDVGADNPLVYAQEIGYRGWMRNGITFTGNSDQAYPIPALACFASALAFARLWRFAVDPYSRRAFASQRSQ